MKIIIALIALLPFHVHAAPELSLQDQHRVENQQTTEAGADSRGCCRDCERFQCVDVCGNVTVGGNLSEFGNETIGGSLAVSGPATFSGPTSLTGSVSINGAPAGGGISAYAYIYNVGPQTIALEAPILFDTNGPLSGITHTPASAAINIVAAGTYAIYWSVSGLNPNQFAITVNGAPSTSTIYGSAAGAQQNTALSILTLAAGDVLNLINHTSSAGVPLQTLAGGTQVNVNASVLILRLA
jgi:hypothetical protein